METLIFVASFRGAGVIVDVDIGFILKLSLDMVVITICSVVTFDTVVIFGTVALEGAVVVIGKAVVVGGTVVVGKSYDATTKASNTCDVSGIVKL